MDNKLYRKKSMERISSPEQLNDYIRVSNPGVWVVMASIIILLIGVCVWGIYGRLETTVESVAVVKDSKLTVYVKEENIDKISKGMTFTMKEKKYIINKVDTKPMVISKDFDKYALHVGNLQVGEWVYKITSKNKNMDDGVYSAEILVESVSPMSFILN